MKKRPITRLVLLNILTLGTYELVWLAKTRDEIVSNHGLPLPKARYLVINEGLQLVSFIGLIVILLVIIPIGNHKIDSLQRPSPQCFIDYAKSADAVRAGSGSTVSSDCQKVVDDYYDGSDSANKLIGSSVAAILWIFIIMMGLALALLNKWLKPFAFAVERVTKGSLSSTTSLLLLAFAPPTIAMAIIQAAFNDLPAESSANSRLSGPALVY